MARGYTTKEQSKHLVELGLDQNTADMYYDGYGRLPQGYAYTLISPNSFECDYPCWSLTALLELMPLYNGTTPRLSWGKGLYTCFYYQGKMISNPNSMVDAAFEMVCWLIEQGYIKVNK